LISENVNEAQNASNVTLLKILNFMANQFDIKQLLQKPIAMMTGEELTFLLNSSMEAKANEQTPVVQKRTYYGIEGIAQVFGCSVPTANRIKRSGIIDAAITQIGRKIIVDADMALALAKEAEANKEKKE
jgi:hypothetical protein